jgi:hypothetical protein
MLLQHGNERAPGIAFQSLSGAYPQLALMVERDRFDSHAAEEVGHQVWRRDGGIEGEHTAAAAQPERPQGILSQRLAIEGSRGLGFGQRSKAFAVEPGRTRRGDGPQAMAVVLVAEPHGVGGQALGCVVGGEGAVAVAHQAGGGRNP